MDFFKKLITIICLLCAITVVNGQSLDNNYLSYIQKYHEIAVRQQKLHGIPASIILAQGLLESGAGKSILVTEGNNHFGIKCHDWTGGKMYHDDDTRNECFRKYRHAMESFEDHSLFLKNRPRYAFLFELAPTDYKGWAKGLKAAGYATDPGYAQKLINIIERYDLHNYDLEKAEIALFSPEMSNQEGAHTIYKSNYIKLIVAGDSDTFSSIAAEMDISEKRLRTYNDVTPDAILKKGDIVYLSKKKRKAAYANRIHVVQPGETMYSISQVYGIRLINLYNLNNMPFTQGAYTGQILKLR